jgi:hypothetical protein
VSDTLSATFSEKESEMDDDAASKGNPSVNLLSRIVGAGGTIAGELVMAVIGISVLAASTAENVRLVQSTCCWNCVVVTPVATVTVHNVAAGSAAVAAVNRMVAVKAPEFETAAVKLVVPHPSVVGTAGDDITNSGRTIVSSSPVEISAFS